MSTALIEDVQTAAYDLGRAQRASGGPRTPHKVAEVNNMLRGLENGDPVVTAVYRGYVAGWESGT